MSFVTYEFIGFVFALMLLYFIVPLKVRCYVLLAGSLVFYQGAGWQDMLFLGAAAATAYVCGLLIAKFRGPVPDRRRPKDAGEAGAADSGRSHKDQKGKALAVLITGLLILFGMLVYSKIGARIQIALSQILGGKGITWAVIVPLGISYYTFASVGYLADVYWKKDRAEKNPLKLLLYICYFPQILQGPIPKHKTLAPQLNEGHRFDYDRVCFGLQRAVWGFFKKLVIADRLSIMVREVFDHYLNYTGFIFLFALVGAVFQLYADFSGCMDIALGVSEAFGIKLDENFRRPFFATSAAEFWRRWHISLGTWFKDYVYMPLSTSGWVMKIGKFFRDHGGRTAARNAVTTVPLLVVWLLTGLWHGTGADYVVWGLYWGGIIIFSTWMAPVYRKLNQRLGLNNDLHWWKEVRRFRTFGIYMVGRLLTLPGNLATSRWIGRKIFTWNPWVLFDGTLFRLGWDYKDAVVAIIALLIVWRVSVLQENGVHIRESVSKWPVVFRWLFYCGAILSVMIFGIYGSGSSASTFVYMNF